MCTAARRSSPCCCLRSLDGCGAEDPTADRPTATSSRGAATVAAPRSPTSRSELDPADFTADVTNPWFPLEPGTRWTYRETTEDGEVLEVVVTATSVTRKIANGVSGAGRPRHRHPRRRDHRGHPRLVRPGRAPARSGTSARTPPSSRTARSPTREGSFEAGRRRRPGRRDHAGRTRGGHGLPAGVLRGRQAEDNGEVLALDGTATVPAGVVRRPGADRRHHPARAGRARAQVLRPRRRRGAHRSTSRAAPGKSCCSVRATGARRGTRPR